MEESTELQSLSFPSAAFPGADLRISDRTDYACSCAGCAEPLRLHFGSIVNSNESWRDKLGPELTQVVLQYFPRGAYNHVERLNCDACGASYIIRLRVDETSVGAYRAEVLGVSQIVPHRDA
jgi:hypothetical protein